MKKSHRRYIECMIFTTLIILGVLCFFSFESQGFFQFNCPIYFTFDIACIGCGGTRMINSLVGLNFYQAFRWNNFVFLNIPFAINIYCTGCSEYIANGKLSMKTLKPMGFLIIGAIAYTIIRNIPGFEWLMPQRIN